MPRQPLCPGPALLSQKRICWVLWWGVTDISESHYLYCMQTPICLAIKDLITKSLLSKCYFTLNHAKDSLFFTLRETKLFLYVSLLFIICTSKVERIRISEIQGERQTQRPVLSMGHRFQDPKRTPKSTHAQVPYVK